MTICILGRQPAIGLAELQSLYGPDNVTLIAPNAALVENAHVRGEFLGGTQKVARLLDTYASDNWQKVSQQVVRQLQSSISDKITLGISAYNFPVSAREVQKTGLVFKRKMKEKKQISIRLVPNPLPALNTAQVLHNKLARPGKKELLIIRGSDGKSYVGETTYVQDIEAYTFRDRSRPRRDAYVGMLPPKLAQIMINLAKPSRSESATLSEDSAFPAERTKKDQPVAVRASEKSVADEPITEVSPRLLDPFCGTGVVLQEAALMGYAVYGTDLSERMIRYTRDNLVWLSDTHHIFFDKYFHVADAQDAVWQQPIDAVVGEGYLGKPLATTPERELLEGIIHECNGIMGTFLKNISAQLAPGTPLCIAAPAWHIRDEVRHLPCLKDLESIGFTRREFMGIPNDQLIYRREDQIVGRELLVLIKQ